MSCTADWECAIVTDLYQGAACVDGKCRCQSSLGFSGGGNVEDPCICTAPKDIVWISNKPYCILPLITITPADI